MVVTKPVPLFPLAKLALTNARAATAPADPFELMKSRMLAAVDVIKADGPGPVARFTVIAAPVTVTLNGLLPTPGWRYSIVAAWRPTRVYVKSLLAPVKFVTTVVSSLIRTRYVSVGSGTVSGISS